MALFVNGETKCIICKKRLFVKKADWFCTPNFIENNCDKLQMYSDEFFHYECYKNWAIKDEFQKKFNDFLKENPDFPIKKIIQKENSALTCNELEFVLKKLHK